MRILFIGNSHTFFNDMPETFADMVEAASGSRPEVTMLAYGGRSLIWHSQEYFALRFNLMYGNYDYCIIQQQAHPFPGIEETRKGLAPMVDICRAAGVRPVLYMPWAEKRFPENQEKITDCMVTLGKEFDIEVAPVGLVWKEMLAVHPEIDLFWKDGEHAGPVGDYLIALVLTMCILKKTDFAYPAKMRDFFQGLEIDRSNLRLIEDAAKTPVDIDDETVSAIAQTAARVLESL
ncbi:MAG: hypothetical protein IJM08_04855 [Firmicutes bacterium]|nr:hypothetical protein [Bacillota bacterium]